MRKLVCYSLPVLFFFSFIGCYDVPNLVKDPSEGLTDQAFNGVWLSHQNAAYSRGVLLRIERDGDSHWYLMDYTDRTTGETRKYRALLHQLGKRKILSFSSEKDPQKDYSLFAVELELKRSTPLIHAFALSENAPRFENRDKLEQFLGSSESDGWFRKAFIFEKQEELQTVEES